MFAYLSSVRSALYIRPRDALSFRFLAVRSLGIQIIQIGLQLHTGGTPTGPVVFDVDSFSIDSPIIAPDAAAH